MLPGRGVKFMRPVQAPVLLLSLFLATAAAPQTPAAPEDSAADQAEAVIQHYYRDFYAAKYADALADIAQLEPDESNPTGQAVVDAMRAAALLGLKRDADAQPLIKAIDTLSPTDPTARAALFDGAVLTHHWDVAADSIDSLIERAPDAVRDIDWDELSYFLDNEPKGEDVRNEDRRVALARIGYGGDTETGHWRAIQAVRILVGRGDFQGASELLPYVKEPEAFENMLVQKRYSALWPRLEEIGGSHLGQLRAEALASAERAYLASPDDMQKLQGYVDALRHSGRLEDAIALRSKLPQTPAGMAKADEKTGWVVDSVAGAYQDAGRISEADKLYASLNDPPRTDAGWRVSMIINRLEVLVMAGKFHDASALLPITEDSAKNDGSPYAQQLVRRLRYCVLSSTGKKDEAARQLPDLLKHADDALEPTVEGLLCAGDADAAERLVLKGLDNPDKAKRETFEEQFVRALQPVPLTNDDPSVWDNSWKVLRARPAIAAAYQRLGRDLPANLLPEKPSALARR